MTTDHEATVREGRGVLAAIKAWWNRPSDLELELQATRKAGADLAQANIRLKKKNTELAKDRDDQAQGWCRALNQVTVLENELARVTVEKDHYFKESTERGKQLAELGRIKGVVKKLKPLVAAINREIEKLEEESVEPNDECKVDDNDLFDDDDFDPFDDDDFDPFDDDDDDLDDDDDDDDFDMDDDEEEDENYCTECGNLMDDCEC